MGQIDKLAKFIMAEVEGEPSENEGAGDTAIRIIKQLQANLLKYGYHFEGCPCYIPPGEWKNNDHHTKTKEELSITVIEGITRITVKCTCGYLQALEGR